MEGIITNTSISSGRENNIEILLHNLSHSDLVLSVNNQDKSLSRNSCIARPKFNRYREVSEKLLLSVKSIDDKSNPPKILRQPIFSRQPGSNRVSDHVANDEEEDLLRSRNSGTKKNKTTSDTGNGNVNNSNISRYVDKVSSGQTIAAGFDLSSSTVREDPSFLRFRRDDKNMLWGSSDGKEKIATTENNTNNSKEGSHCYIDAAYLPLLALLIPKWIEGFTHIGRNNCRKILFLISGRGTPRDSNASVLDNSTLFMGMLMTRFMEIVYPDIEIIHIHSTTNLFRYDENIVFVKRELLPLIDSIRDELVARVGPAWKDNMRLTLSFADGSSARISAINASLRHYRPSYFHFWQLKTFWSETIFCEDDVECHSFEEISTEPAMSTDQLDPSVQLVVAEMLKFRMDFNAIINDPNSDHDLGRFWLRKTKKPVLAILLVQKPGQQPKLYRGTNMEVSMPTGSLCAERNVIGTALADDISLRRQDLKMVAVYSCQELSSMPLVTPTISLLSPTTPTFLHSAKLASPKQQAYSLILEQTIPSPVSSTLSATATSLSSSSSGKGGELVPTLSQALSQTSSDGTELSEEAGGQKRRKIMNIPISRQSNTAASNFKKSPPEGSTGTSSLQIDVSNISTLVTNATNNKCMTPVSHTFSSTGVITRTRTGSGGSTLSTQLDGHLKNSSEDRDGGGGGGGGGGTSPRQSRGAKTKLTRRVSSAKRKLPPSLVIAPSSFSALGESSQVISQSKLADAAADDVSFYPSHVCAPVRTIIVDETDMNPLKPCGACHEWLKKIAEVNPQFSVVTFSDAQCQGVYVEQIRD